LTRDCTPATSSRPSIADAAHVSRRGRDDVESPPHRKSTTGDVDFWGQLGKIRDRESDGRASDQIGHAHAKHVTGAEEQFANIQNPIPTLTIPIMTHHEAYPICNVLFCAKMSARKRTAIFFLIGWISFIPRSELPVTR